VKQADMLGRDVASGQEARALSKIGVTYGSVDETLRELGWAPNRQPGQRGRPMWK
jgi:hypothetical protein